MTQAPVSDTRPAEGCFIANASDFAWLFPGSQRALRIDAGDRCYDRLAASGTFQ